MFEWDEAKRAGNIAKHGVDFADVARFDWEGAVASPDPRQAEHRLIALGRIDGRLYVCVYAIRPNALRIISLRKANAREIRSFEND